MNASEIYLYELLRLLKGETDNQPSIGLMGYAKSKLQYVPLRLDLATHSLQVMDYEHHEIHEGRHFEYSDKATIASGASVEYLITTPDTLRWTHK